MPKKMWQILAAIVVGLLVPISTPMHAASINCPKLRIVFARGSGGKRWEDKNYKSFAGWIEKNLTASGWSKSGYDFVDLDYPAIGINIDNFWAVLGAYFGAGDSYEFGRSVNTGVKNLLEMVNSSCPDTKYVLGGYSQGAMVVSKAIHSISSDKIIYVATFGDPKLYLPEGKGLFPSACKGKNLSDYRAYVPDCHAYEGMLGSYKPYEPVGYEGKLGTWCNKKDIFCSSYLSLNDHLSYASDKESEDLYKDASKMIVAKANAAFNMKNSFVSSHDTAFLIDSTGSMDGLTQKYRDEALRLAKETLDSGGRVALYDYKDYKEGYEPAKGCDFYDCTIEKFTEKLDKIIFNGGRDWEESLLGSSFAVMKELKWKYGSTKTLVVLTDAGYHNPDYDLNRTTLEDVVKLSKLIDPVHIYVVTLPDLLEEYQELTTATGGKAVNIEQNLAAMRNEIMARFTSLPQLEEEFDDEEYHNNLPSLEILDVKETENGVKIKFKNSGTKAMVIVNDLPIGLTDGNEITIDKMNKNLTNTVSLAPILDDRRGATISVEFAGEYTEDYVTSYDIGYKDGTTRVDSAIIPKAPNTGKR